MPGQRQRSALRRSARSGGGCLFKPQTALHSQTCPGVSARAARQRNSSRPLYHPTALGEALRELQGGWVAAHDSSPRSPTALRRKPASGHDTPRTGSRGRRRTAEHVVAGGQRRRDVQNIQDPHREASLLHRLALLARGPKILRPCGKWREGRGAGRLTAARAVRAWRLPAPPEPT